MEEGIDLYKVQLQISGRVSFLTVSQLRVLPVITNPTQLQHWLGYKAFLCSLSHLMCTKILRGRHTKDYYSYVVGEIAKTQRSKMIYPRSHGHFGISRQEFQYFLTQNLLLLPSHFINSYGLINFPSRQCYFHS